MTLISIVQRFKSIIHVRDDNKWNIINWQKVRSVLNVAQVNDLDKDFKSVLLSLEFWNQR